MLPFAHRTTFFLFFFKCMRNLSFPTNPIQIDIDRILWWHWYTIYSMVCRRNVNSIFIHWREKRLSESVIDSHFPLQLTWRLLLSLGSEMKQIWHCTLWSTVEMMGKTFNWKVQLKSNSKQCGTLSTESTKIEQTLCHPNHLLFIWIYLIASWSACCCRWFFFFSLVKFLWHRYRLWAYDNKNKTCFLPKIMLLFFLRKSSFYTAQ